MDSRLILTDFSRVIFPDQDKLFSRFEHQKNLDLEFYLKYVIFQIGVVNNGADCVEDIDQCKGNPLEQFDTEQKRTTSPGINSDYLSHPEDQFFRIIWFETGCNKYFF